VAPSTLISVRPVEAGPGHHIAAAVTGHAQIMAAVSDHLTRAYAHHEGLADAHSPSDDQALS